MGAPVLDKVKGMNIAIVRASINEYKALSCKVKYSNPAPTFSWKMQFFANWWCYGSISNAIIPKHCRPDDKNWTKKDMTMWGSFSSSNSTYTPAEYLSLAYLKCTAVNTKGTDSMVFLFWRHSWMALLKVVKKRSKSNMSRLLFHVASV